MLGNKSIFSNPNLKFSHFLKLTMRISYQPLLGTPSSITVPRAASYKLPNSATKMSVLLQL